MNKVEELLASYHLEAQEIVQLEGYGSANYKVKCAGKNYLLKHYTDPEEYKLILEEDRILKQLSNHKASFQLLSSLQELQTCKDGTFSRLMLFIEGELLFNVIQTKKLLHDFGAAVGQMNKNLLPIKSDIIKARALFWDMKHTMLNADKAKFITDATDRKLVHYFLDLFEHQIVPIQHGLRHSIIHSDLNDNNVLVSNEKVTGIIDFGDIAYSPLIYEVAIALTYIMLANENDPFDKAAAFLNGYHKVLPLQAEEVKLLTSLIPSRLCVSVCNSAKKKSEGNDTEYILVSEKPAWKLLHKWITINPIWISNFFLDAIDGQPISFDTDAIKANRVKFTGKSLGTSYKEPIHMTGAAFQYMYDEKGNTYLDAYNNIPHVGHCHPIISKVISKQVRQLNTNTRYLYPELTDYAMLLSKHLPSSLSKVYYVNSGSAASDLAVRMARLHTKNEPVAILKNGYHGTTISGIAISDYKHNGKGGGGKPNHIISLPLPKIYKGQFKTGVAYAQHAIQLLEEEIKNNNTPSALIVEPVSGCGGQVPLAVDYLKILMPFLKEHNILLIADEVQTGFGRLGNYFWGFELHGVIPDIVIMGKPMGNGHPIAAVVTTPAIAKTFANGMEFFTSFGGNPVSCRVATEVLNILQEENLTENANIVGGRLKNSLSELQKKYNCVGDVRGEGLFIGVEFIDEKGEPNNAVAGYVKEEMKKRFILVGTDGPFNNIIKVKPPLCFSEVNADFFVEQMGEILKDI